jgi:N-acyl-D-aspartate/D-glutamate deacylase
MLDLRIEGGQIVDGTGAPRRGGDIGIRDGRIVAIGAVDESARRKIDARGAIVAPGFVDVHTHYDAQVLWDPTLAPSTLHGVTTLVGGNCGFSIAPLTPEGAPYLATMLARVEGMPLSSLEQALSWDWTSTADYLGLVEGAVVPNIGFMVGHTAVRRAVMGPAAKERAATHEEIDAMRALLRTSLEAGGLGFSSSRATSHNDADGDPVPSRCATVEEVLALADVVRSVPGTHLEMVPYVGSDPFPAEVEDLLVELTVRTGRPIDWNTVYAEATNGDEVRSKLAVSDRAAAAGGRVIGLFMPMPKLIVLNFLSGFVLELLPGWMKPMTLPPDEKAALLRDPVRRAELRDRAASSPMRYANWAGYVVRRCFTPDTRRHEGRQVADIAAEEGKDPFDALVDIALLDDLRTTFAFPPVGDGDDDWAARGEMLQDPRVVIGASDAGAHLDMIDTFRYPTSLLQECVRDRQFISTERAVHLMTEVPAAMIGLRDRGVLREGAWGDIVVFDEDAVGGGELETREDLPGGALRLFAESTGVAHVLVNGTPILDAGRLTGDQPGHVLRSGRDTGAPALQP